MKAHTLCLVSCQLLFVLSPMESIDQDKIRARAGAGDHLNPRLLPSVDPPITNASDTFDNAQLFTQDTMDHLRRDTDDKSHVPLPRHPKRIDHNNTVWRSGSSEIVTGDTDHRPEKPRYLCKRVELDTHRIINSAHNTVTHCDLTAANHTLSAQSEAAAGTGNAGATSIKVPVRATHWPGGSAFYAYGLLAVITAWACSRIYSSYVLQKKSDDLANQVYERESEADDDLHEFMETQGELAASAQAHSEITLSVMSHCISSQINELQSVSGQQFAEGSLKRINVLSTLGSYTRYEPEGAQVDLHGFVDAAVSDMLRTMPIRSDTVVSINDIEQAHLPSGIATPLGLVLFELLENAFLHAFASSSPANYIHMQMKIEENRHSGDHSVHLSVQDSGRGFPQDLQKVCKANSGLAIVKRLIARLHGEINFVSEPSAQISIIVPHIFHSIRHI